MKVADEEMLSGKGQVGIGEVETTAAAARRRRATSAGSAASAAPLRRGLRRRSLRFTVSPSRSNNSPIVLAAGQSVSGARRSR